MKYLNIAAIIETKEIQNNFDKGLSAKEAAKPIILIVFALLGDFYQGH